MRKSKRVLFKPKVFGFNPYADQVPAIKQIMEESGQQSEAPILRMLIDEALVARRRKVTSIEVPEQPAPTQELAETLQTVQVLLLNMIGQGKPPSASRVFLWNCCRKHWRKRALEGSACGKIL